MKKCLNALCQVDKVFIENYLCLRAGLLSPSPVKQLLRQKRGFSLVEVVIAIGLSTFALLVMFSLLPVGLNTLQDANRQIMETEIFNTIGAELNATKYDSLDDYVGPELSPNYRYYDIEGQEMDSDTGAVFFVKCKITTAVPGDETRRVRVFISFQKNIKDPDWNEDGPYVKERAFLLANRGI
jgi:uncharacterized protein (TIGR02598 family)